MDAKIGTRKQRLNETEKEWSETKIEGYIPLVVNTSNDLDWLK